MTKTDFVAFVLFGAILGSCAHFAKEDGAKAQRIVDDLPAKLYEACLESNKFNEQFDPEQEERDCESELLE